MSLSHYAILIHNASPTQLLIEQLLAQKSVPALKGVSGKGWVVSNAKIQELLEEEKRHGTHIIRSISEQTFKTRSSGERKKDLLSVVLKTPSDYLIVENPYDYLDTVSKQELQQQLIAIATHTCLVQIISRKEDALPITTHYFKYDASAELVEIPKAVFNQKKENTLSKKQNKVPAPLKVFPLSSRELVRFNSVSVSYGTTQILNNISWVIKVGEFWELRGKNGSGKTTLLTMITGENHKAYGQNLHLFGAKKGSGESVWDIKKRIGYFTASMLDSFKGYHTLEDMLLSGLHDSVGLYVQPSDAEIRLAKEWLQLLGLYSKKHRYFHEMPQGQKCILMLARAMVKHPPLLLLDEPTAGLDDASAQQFLHWVTKISNETETAILYVSHRKETALKPRLVFELQPTPAGSIGQMVDS